MANKKLPLTPAQKAAKWKALATKRINRVLKGIESLSKLSAKSRYSYTSAQVKIMKDSFSDALNDCFARYEGTVIQKEGIKL